MEVADADLKDVVLGRGFRVESRSCSAASRPLGDGKWLALLDRTRNDGVENDADRCCNNKMQDQYL